MRVARFSPALLAGYVIAVLCRGDEPAASSATPAAAPAPQYQFRGAGSCSATACHGSIKAFDGLISSVSRNEHTTWISSDPHSRAFEVLFNERSDRIARNLAGSAAVYPRASEDARCLACHTTPRPYSERDATAWLNTDGVGCESCHGASERYLGAHTTGEWKEKNRGEKEASGLWNTKDLTRRARICTGCHVGEHSSDGPAVRDVNHDLIAAGHPRLSFELSAFLDNMPSHWREKDENADSRDPSRRAADFPARAWAIGRATTIEAALALLEKRVPEARGLPEALVEQGSAAGKRTAPWPEFSEYGCFSCHHELRDQAWRRGRQADGGAVGAPRWGTWILPASEDLLASLVVDPDQSRAAHESLKRVTVAMENAGPREEIRAAAHDATRSLKKCLAAVAARPFDVGTIERLIDRIDDPRAWERITSWDEAAQRYLALVPLYQSWVALAPDRGPKQQVLRKHLGELLERLRFPTGFDSPRGFEAGRLPSQER